MWVNRCSGDRFKFRSAGYPAQRQSNAGVLLLVQIGLITRAPVDAPFACDPDRVDLARELSVKFVSAFDIECLTGTMRKNP